MEEREREDTVLICWSAKRMLEVLTGENPPPRKRKKKGKKTTLRNAANEFTHAMNAQDTARMNI